jgi:hypothetical protein
MYVCMYACMYVYVCMCVWCIVSLGGMNIGVPLKLKFVLDSVDCVYVCVCICMCMVYCKLGGHE